MSFSEEKRKKLIVPAVALMMCAVAMIGIGYAALSSTIENSGNQTTIQELSVVLYKSQSKEGGPISDGSIKDSIPIEYYTKQNGNVVNYYISTEEATIGTAYMEIKSTLTGVTTVNVEYEITTSGPNKNSFTISLYEDKDPDPDIGLPSSITLDSNGSAAIPILVKIEGNESSSAGSSAVPLTFNIKITVTEA